MIAYVMSTPKKQKVTQIWRLRVPLDLVARVRDLAGIEQRSTTKQAAVLLAEALQARAHTEQTEKEQ
jgi:hypothetical protein